MIHPKAAVSTNGEWESSTKDAVSSLLRNWGPTHVKHIRSVDAQFPQTCFEEAPNSQRHHALGVHTNSSSPRWFLFLIPIYLMVRPRLKPHYTLFPGKHTFWQIHPRHGNNDSELNCQSPCNSDQCYCIPISWHLDCGLSQKKCWPVWCTKLAPSLFFISAVSVQYRPGMNLACRWPWLWSICEPFQDWTIRRTRLAGWISSKICAVLELLAEGSTTSYLNRSSCNPESLAKARNFSLHS